MRMTVPAFVYVSTIGLLAVWLLIIWRGRRERMIRRYLAFYVFVVVYAAISCVQLLLAHFLDPYDYAALYFVDSLITALGGIVLMLQIFSTEQRPGCKGPLDSLCLDPGIDLRPIRCFECPCLL